MTIYDVSIFEDFSDTDFDGNWTLTNQAEIVDGQLYLPGVYTDVRSRGRLEFE